MSWLAGRAAMAEARLCQASPGASVPKSMLTSWGSPKTFPSVALGTEVLWERRGMGCRGAEGEDSLEKPCVGESPGL